MHRTLAQIMQEVDLGAPFADLSEDIRLLRKAFSEQAASQQVNAYQLRIDVLKAPFFRNKAAYVVGRIVSSQRSYPFIVGVAR